LIEVKDNTMEMWNCPYDMMFVSFNVNTTDATGGPGTAYTSGNVTFEYYVIIVYVKKELLTFLEHLSMLIDLKFLVYVL
jgi:hypothetical protein